MNLDPLDPARIARLETEELLGLLETRRWFAAKSGRPRAARVAAVIPVELAEGRFVITRVAVTDAAGGESQYQLPLAADGAGRLIDAVEDPTFLDGLVSLCGRGARFEHEGESWIVEPAGNTPLVLPPDAKVSVLSVEQSNTSLRVGDAAILKLFRRLQPGVNPDVEITDFLTRRHSFPHAAVLLAVLRFEGRDGNTVAGMMQELVPEAQDGWRYALECAAGYFRAGGKEPGAGSSREKPVIDVVGKESRQPPFVTDAARLGEVTRELHEVLASDHDDEGFAPEPATGEDVAAWGSNVRRQIEGALDLLERAAGGKSIPAERSGEVTALLRRREHYLTRVEEMVESIGDDAGFLIRHHGDYHLGQVLRSSSGEFIVIDFEGEPSRPMDERRSKHSALRDVAGMLRSFSYAAATLAISEGSGLDPRTREIVAGRWERACRVAFVDAYLAAGSAEEEDEAGLLPEDPDNVRRMIDLFETEKVFYELAYELGNRPSWVWIPLRGISQLMYAR
jgi:trehalose synthase-fused probable maltokinase